MSKVWGLPLYEIVIPVVSWTLISLQYLYLFYRGAFRNAFQSLLPIPPHSPFLFFSKARRGWVVQNYLTGQATANSTR
jgi:hypothetical protein